MNENREIKSIYYVHLGDLEKADLHDDLEANGSVVFSKSQKHRKWGTAI